EGDLGEGGLLGVEDRREELDARVGHLDVAEADLLIGLATGGEGREHGGLARAGIADDSCAHAGPISTTERGPAARAFRLPDHLDLTGSEKRTAPPVSSSYLKSSSSRSLAGTLP